MSREDQERWDTRYREGAYRARTHPSTLLVEWLPRVEHAGVPAQAIDLACGTGRNALYLARRGWRVDAVDISEVALERLSRTVEDSRLPVKCIQADLEADDGRNRKLLTSHPYALAVMFRYANLPLVATLVDALPEGAWVIVEGHLVTEDDVAGPQSPRFRLPPGALRAAGAGLEIVAYHEGTMSDPDGRRVALAQLVARKPAPE